MSDFSIKEMLDIVLKREKTRDRTPYVYGLIDKETNMWYIGSRVAKGCHPNELGVTYFTSSKTFRPLYKSNPSRFISKIFYIGEDAVYRERQLLEIMNAKDNEKSYNNHNGWGTFNGRLAALKTVELGVGVHARTKEEMSADALKMVHIHKEAKTGIFSKESRRKCLETQKRLGVGVYDVEAKRRGAIKSGTAAVVNKTGIHHPDFDKSTTGKKMHETRYRCGECDLTGPATSIALHQKSKKHVGRIKLEKDSEEWINSFRSAKAAT